MPLAAIGVFLLFLGWFGFNGGSVLAAEPHLVSLVFVTTALAAVSGAIASIAISWARKVDKNGTPVRKLRAEAGNRETWPAANGLPCVVW